MTNEQEDSTTELPSLRDALEVATSLYGWATREGALDHATSAMSSWVGEYGESIARAQILANTVLAEEVDRLMAAITRVELLADGWYGEGSYGAAEAIREALADRRSRDAEGDEN